MQEGKPASLMHSLPQSKNKSGEEVKVRLRKNGIWEYRIFADHQDFEENIHKYTEGVTIMEVY